MKIIAIANQKGGVGKTTTSICVSQVLQDKGYKVLLVDTDPQCNASRIYHAKIEDEATMADIICNDTPAEECIQQTEYGDIIPCDPLLVGEEKIVNDDERKFLHLKRACRGLENKYDYIIIDSRPVIGVTLKNVLNVADYIVIPVEGGWAVEGFMQLYEAIDLARDNNEKLKIAGFLSTRTNGRTNASKAVRALTDTLGDKIETRTFETNIRQCTKVGEMALQAKPLSVIDPKCTTYQDYIKFVDELLEVIDDGESRNS